MEYSVCVRTIDEMNTEREENNETFVYWIESEKWSKPPVQHYYYSLWLWRFDHKMFGWLFSLSLSAFCSLALSLPLSLYSSVKLKTNKMSLVNWLTEILTLNNQKHQTKRLCAFVRCIQRHFVEKDHTHTVCSTDSMCRFKILHSQFISNTHNITMPHSLVLGVGEAHWC